MGIFDRFQSYFMKSWMIVRWNEEVIAEISKDKKVMPYAILIAFLPTFFIYVLQHLSQRSFDWQDFVVQLVIWILSLSLVPLLAVIGRNLGKYKNAFATGVAYMEFIRPAFCFGVLSWVVLVPFVLWIVGVKIDAVMNIVALAAEIFTLALYYRLLKFSFKLESFRAFLILMVALIILTGVSGFILNLLPKLGLQSEVLSKLLANS